MITVVVGNHSATITADQPPDVEAAIADLGTEPVLKLVNQTKINGKRVRWVGVNNGVWVDFEINDKWYFVRAGTVAQYLDELLWLLWSIEANQQPTTA